MTDHSNVEESVDGLLIEFRPSQKITWDDAKLALSAAQLDDYNTQIVKKLEKLDYPLTSTWKEVGRILNRAGQYSLSQMAYYNAYNRNIDDLGLRNALVYTFRQLGEREKAIRLFSARLLENNTDLSAIEKLGNLHFETGKYAEAAQYYEQFLINRPGDPKKEELLKEAQRIIGSAIEKLDASSVSKEEIKQVKSYLKRASEEASSSSLSFQKTVGIVVLAAAIISAVADSKDAAKNIHEAFEYISKVSQKASEHLKPLMKDWHDDNSP